VVLFGTTPPPMPVSSDILLIILLSVLIPIGSVGLGFFAIIIFCMVKTWLNEPSKYDYMAELQG